MQRISCLLIFSALFIACTAVFAQPGDKNRGPSQEDLRAFAKEELDGPFVKYIKPIMEVKRNRLLFFRLGEIDTIANKQLELQLHIELLRKYSAFGDELTPKALKELEDIVIKMKPGPYGFEGSREFKSITIDYAVQYAARKKLFVAPIYAFRAKQYYVEHKLVNKGDVTFEQLRREVGVYFENDAIGFRAPSMAIGRDVYEDTGVAYFDVGGIIQSTAERSAVNLLFQFELMNRRPNIDRATLVRYQERILDAIKKQFENERRRGDDFQDTKRKTFSELMRDAFDDYAKQRNLVRGVYMPPDDDVERPIVGYEGVLIRVDDNVKTIVIVPALVFRFAQKTKTPISLLDKQYVESGREREFRAGKYVYQLEYKDGKHGEMRPFSIPDSVDKNGELRLR